MKVARMKIILLSSIAVMMVTMGSMTCMKMMMTFRSLHV
jgi:hypothetical protein